MVVNLYFTLNQLKKLSKLNDGVIRYFSDLLLDIELQINKIRVF